LFYSFSDHPVFNLQEIPEEVHVMYLFKMASAIRFIRLATADFVSLYEIFYTKQIPTIARLNDRFTVKKKQS